MVGSICDRTLLKAIRAAHRFEAVIHLAALSDAAQSVREPDRYESANFHGSRMIGEKVFQDLPTVFSSSAAVYGSSDEALGEDAETAPANPYGQSKLDAEMHITNALCLRYFNVSGCDPSIGTGHKPQTHLIPRVLQAARDGTVFEIQGDGSAVRDFVDVRDVADANYRALMFALANPERPTLNICSGQGYSVLNVIRTAARVTGRKIKTTMGPKREGDPDKVVGLNARAADVLGWHPQHDLEDQIAACWDWMNSQKAAA